MYGIWLGLGWEAFVFFLTTWDTLLILNFSELNLPIFIAISSNPSKFPRGTVLSGPEATFWINSFKTNWTIDSLFTFGVITSFAVLKRSSKKQCCNCFLHHVLFFESSAVPETHRLFFNSSMRQTNAPYSFASEQIFMAFAKSFILLQTSFICFNRLDDFMILTSFLITPDRLKASSYRKYAYLLRYWPICW